MKKNLCLVPLCLVVGALSAFATPMTQEQVCVAAQKWLAQHPDFKGSTLLSGGLVALPGTNKGLNTLYKIEVSPSGYLILNSNDVLPVVQIYSKDQLLDEVANSDGFRAVLQTCAEANEAMCENAVSNSNGKIYKLNQAEWKSFLPSPQPSFKILITAGTQTRQYSTNVGPLIRSNWYQGLPLNYFSPTASGGGEGGGVVIGCTATAVSMMMDANQWPTYGKGTYLFNHFAIVPNEMPTCGLFLADTRAKYHWDDMITRCADGSAWERLQTNRMGMDVGTLIDSDFKPGGTGSGFYDNPGALFNNFRYSGDIIICSQNTANVLGNPNRYVKDWIPYLRESLVDRLPVYVMITGHSIVCDGIRELESGGETKTEVCLNLGFGGEGFWVDVSRVDFEEETATDPDAWKGWYYFHSIVTNVRPNPVPLADPVPRKSNPDTVVTWEIPKHYVEMQGDVIKQRVKIITEGSTSGTASLLSGSITTDKSGETSPLAFANYSSSYFTATFGTALSVSAESQATIDYSINYGVANRTLTLRASRDGGSTWESVPAGSITLTHSVGTWGAAGETGTLTVSLADYAGTALRLQLCAGTQDTSGNGYASTITINKFNVDGLVIPGAPTFSAEFPAQRYNSMKLSEIPGLEMPTGTESKYYKFRIELFADQKRGAGARWYPTSLEDGADDPSCPDNDTWIETNISKKNPGVLPTADLPLNITTKGKGVPTIIPLPLENSYSFTTSIPGGKVQNASQQTVTNYPAFDIEIETTETSKLLKVSANKNFVEHPLAGDKRQQNSILTLQVTAPDGSQVYEQTALSSRVADYSAWSTELSAAVSIANKRQMKILRYTGKTLPELTDKEEATLSSTFVLYHDATGTSTETWTFCGQDGTELFSFGTDALRNAYIDAVAHRTQPVLSSGMTFEATGDLSDPSNDWIVESGATMPANQRIYAVTFKSGSTISYAPGAELSVVKGCTFEENVSASIGETITDSEPFILSETPIVGLPTPDKHAIATANGNRECILVADSSINVSYSATVSANTTWNALLIEPTDFGSGADYKRFALTPTENSTLDFGNATLQMYSLTVNDGKELTLAGIDNLQVGTFDFVASGHVVLNGSTGNSKIIAGADTILKRSGNGELIINAGKQATLDGIAWAGTITNNGTLVYAGTQTGQAPMTQGAQVIATTMSFGAFDYKGSLLTITGNATCTGTLKLTTSSSDLTVDAGTLNVASFQIPTPNLSPTIRVINGGKIIASGDFKVAQSTSSNQPTYEISGEGSLIKTNRLMSNTWDDSKDQKISIIDGGTLSIGAGGITRYNHGKNSTGYILFMRNGTLTAHADWQVVDAGVTYPATCEIRIAVGSTATLDPNGHTLTYNRAIVDDEPETGTGTLVIGKTGGTGTVVLTKDNSAFAGETRVLGGTLKVENVSALGAGSLSLEGGSLDVGETFLTRTTLAKNPRGKLVAKIGTGKCQIINVETDFVFPQEGFTVELFDTAGNPLPVDNSKFSIENGVLCYDNLAWTGETWENATASASEKNDFTLSGTPESFDVSSSGLGWIHAKIEDGKLVVSLDENTTLDERTGTVTALDSNGNAVGGVKVTQSAAGSELYKNWMRRYVPATGTPNTSPNTSYAADGTSNFMKYALGIDPTKKSGALFTVEKQTVYGEDFLCLAFPRTANGAALADVTFSAESRIGNATAWSAGSETVEKTDGSIVVKIKIGEEARVFTRLRVTQSETTDVSLPAGAILKRNPHNSTSHFSANLQKPELLETAGTFNDVAGTLTFSDGGEVDFATLINNEKSYLLEIDFAAGTAIFVLNENIWLGGNTEFVEFPARGSFSFTNPQLSALLEQQGNADENLTIRIREAWTINEVFGELLQWGAFFQGNALTGDAFYPIFGDGRSMKLFYNNGAWKSSGRWATGTDFGKIPLHPNRPVSVKRKKDPRVEFGMPDEVSMHFTGTVLPCTRVIIPLCSKDDMICSGDAFPQTCSGIDFSGCDASPKAQCISAGAWKDATGSDSAEDCIRILRDKIDLEFISFDFAEL